MKIETSNLVLSGNTLKYNSSKTVMVAGSLTLIYKQDDNLANLHSPYIG